jgi:hypothetical protein
MNNRLNNFRKQPGAILLMSILAAAWLIGGPDLLAKTGIGESAIGTLTWGPAMIAYFWVISPNRSFLRCEVQTFRRLIKGMRPNNK